MSIKREKWYQKTEGMLYNYPAFEIRIRSHQAFIESVRECNISSIDATPSGMIRSYELQEGSNYNISSPVEKDVNHLIIKQNELEAEYRHKIEKLKQWKEIVEASVNNMLDPEQKELINLTYWKRLPWQQVCQQMVLDKNTFYNQRRYIIKVLAWCFGYLEDDEAREVLGLFTEEELWKNKVVNK